MTTVPGTDKLNRGPLKAVFSAEFTFVAENFYINFLRSINT